MSNPDDSFSHENGKLVMSYLSKWKHFSCRKILHADFNYYSYYLYQISLRLVYFKIGFGDPGL